MLLRALVLLRQVVGKLGVKDGGCTCCLTVNAPAKEKAWGSADSVPLFLENLALRVAGKVVLFALVLWLTLGALYRCSV